MANALTGMEVRDQLVDVPEIEECNSVAGAIDLLLKVRCASPEHREELIKTVRTVPGVDRTDTSVVLRTVFEQRPRRPPAGR